MLRAGFQLPGTSFAHSGKVKLEEGMGEEVQKEGGCPWEHPGALCRQLLQLFYRNMFGIA